jgi:hypothetical protein
VPAPRYFELAHGRRGELADRSALLGVERGRGRLLEHLLVAPLQRAVALAEMHAFALAVAQHLDLDVARPAEVLLDIDRVVAEGGLGFGARQREGLGRAAASSTTFMPRPPPPATALISTGQPIFRRAPDLFDRADRAGRARHQRQAELLGGLLGDDLVAHHADVLGRRADEGEGRAPRPPRRSGRSPTGSRSPGWMASAPAMVAAERIAGMLR